MANASTLETDGRYSFVLNGLCQGIDSDFRDERGVQIHLDVELGKIINVFETQGFSKSLDN